ncbi:MAG: gamma-glutamyl-gamma-aminobutyrate hydrolase family protein [Alphaproteobacteria bacterium]|nr:gamma-glutamyl-gamma-aminobutyrate hydrolase family protein [Alphaproteobacteria bacterium]
MARPPRIGITLDYETAPTYSKLPWYALRENYCTSISSLGALPLPLPHEAGLAAAYGELLDGLILTGGAFDVPPHYYGQSGVHETVVTKDQRSAFEFAITREAIARRLPVLGICGGEQLLNVVLGGTLMQHIPDAVKDALDHEQKNPRHESGHEVTVVPGTLLARLTGEARLAVNTSHHQAVLEPAPGVIVNARTADGVIEGIEYPEHPFCLGVQWHPEYHVCEGDRRIFEAFVAACRGG